MCSSTLMQKTVSKRERGQLGRVALLEMAGAQAELRFATHLLAHQSGAVGVGLDADDDVGHVGEPPAHGADTAPDFEHAPSDVRREELEEMRGVALGLAHRFQVVGGVLVGGLGQASIGIVHTPLEVRLHGTIRRTTPANAQPHGTRRSDRAAPAGPGQRPDLLRRHRGARPARPRAPVHDDRARRRRPAAHGRAAALERLGGAADARLVAVPDFSSHARRARVFGASARIEPGVDAGRLGAARSACRRQPGDAAHVSVVRPHRAAARPPADRQLAAAAFLAGLAFAFAPYRAAQMPHLQMLAAFWAPLALLALHAYLDSGRRWWLGVYGAAWLLQALANLYSLYFFSALVGPVGAVVRGRGAPLDRCFATSRWRRSSPPSRSRRPSAPMSACTRGTASSARRTEAQVFSADLDRACCARRPKRRCGDGSRSAAGPRPRSFPASRCWCWSGSRLSRCGATGPRRPRRRGLTLRARVSGTGRRHRRGVRR